MWVNQRRYFIRSLALSLCNFLLIFFLAEGLYHRFKVESRMQMNEQLFHEGLQIGELIQRNISYGLFTTDILAEFLHSTDFQTQHFEQWAKQLQNINTPVSTVQLAPDGVVQHIYPLENNEGAIGHDLLHDKQRDDGARLSIEKRETIIVGPIKLIQNGKYALIARKPIFQENKFWGFSIALLLLEDIVSESITNYSARDVEFQLSGFNPDKEKNPIFIQTDKFMEKNSIAFPVHVPNGHWELKLHSAQTHSSFVWLFHLLFFIFAALPSWYVFKQRKKQLLYVTEIRDLNKKLHDLSLRDELTGLRNLRFSRQILNHLIIQNQRYQIPFSIILLDLDNFKKINDHYGHQIGDSVLRKAARIIEQSIRESDTAARIGGDEFLIIFPNTNAGKLKATVDKISKTINTISNDFKTEEARVSVSLGLSEYSAPQTYDQLIQSADEKMYQAKRSR